MLKTRDVVFKLIKANDDDRTIEGVFSTSDIDRTNEPPIDQETWDLKNFKKNPIVLFGHNNPFGSEPKIAVGSVVKIGLNEKNNLAGKIKFAVDEGVGIYGDFIKTLYNLYKGKFMRAFSVGFMMGEIVVDKKKNTKMVNNQLLEISCVTVPANAAALAKQKGLDLSALDKLDEIKKGIEKKVSERPFPNEHSCRLKNPKDFKPESFRRTTRKHNGKEYSVIMGRLKGETTMTEQAYRYDKKVWKASEAKTHCKDHDGTFEAAKKFILYVDKKNKRICIFDKKEKIGEGRILKQFRNLLFKEAIKVEISAEHDKENNKLIVKQDGEIIKEIQLSKELNNKKVVTESPEGQKEKSSRKRIQNLNKIIRTLLTEKQKVKSNKEKTK